jgi:hypothetical protein
MRNHMTLVEKSRKRTGPWWIFSKWKGRYVPLRLLGTFQSVEDAQGVIKLLISRGVFTEDDLTVGGVDSRA